MSTDKSNRKPKSAPKDLGKFTASKRSGAVQYQLAPPSTKKSHPPAREKDPKSMPETKGGIRVSKWKRVASLAPPSTQKSPPPTREKYSKSMPNAKKGIRVSIWKRAASLAPPSTQKSSPPRQGNAPIRTQQGDDETPTP